MKYFNVVFWVALIGIIFYFTIDSRDLKTGIENFNKDIVEPIDKKVVELTGTETAEMFVEKKITINENKILQIESSKQYFCDPNFSLKDACLKAFAEYTENGKNEFCDQDYAKRFVINTLINTFGIDEDIEKNQETCELLKEESETKISLMKSEIEELEFVLSEGTAREYVKTQKAIEEKEAEDECTIKNLMFNKELQEQCNKKYGEIKKFKISIVKEWYDSKKDDEDFKIQIAKAINKDSLDSKITSDLCGQMIYESDSAKELFKDHGDRSFEFCGTGFYWDHFIKIILNKDKSQ